jgi:hypothetical protein
MRELANWPPGLGAARYGHGAQSAGRAMTIPPRPGLLAGDCAPGVQLTITALMTVVCLPACAKVMGADARYYLGRSLWD